MRVLPIICTGLFTDPTGDDCGMVPVMDRLMRDAFAGWDIAPGMVPGLPYLRQSWVDGTDANCQKVADFIAASGADKVVWFGHSFGGADSVHELNWFSLYTRAKADFTVLFDPVYNPAKFGGNQGPGWLLMRDAAPYVVVYYQLNADIPVPYPGGFGIKGEPLAAPDGSFRINVNTTSWKSPTTGHCTIIADERCYCGSKMDQDGTDDPGILAHARAAIAEAT